MIFLQYVLLNMIYLASAMQGYALLCVGFPSSDVEVETQDEDEVNVNEFISLLLSWKTYITLPQM